MSLSSAYMGYQPLTSVTQSFLLPLCFISGDIGGQMGLFIGASILTILELFDYAYEVSLNSFIHFFLTQTQTFSGVRGSSCFSEVGIKGGTKRKREIRAS